jgi:hypothetical protein
MFMPWAHDQNGFEPAFDPARFNPADAPIVNSDGTVTPTANSLLNPTNGIIFNGENGVPNNLSTAHEFYWAPSLGFAWDLLGDGRTSLRGGYGVTYTRSATSSDCAQSCAANYPLIDSTILINPSFPDPIGAAAAPSTVIGLSTEDFAHMRAAQVQTFSLSIEHQFATNWFVSVAGAGDLANHINQVGNINQPLPYGAYDFNPIINTGTVSSAVYAPYQGYSGISSYMSTGRARWAALEFNVRHPVGKNLTITAAYTWSHNLSDVTGGQYGYPNSGYQDPYAPGIDYGNSPLNYPQIFTTSLIYNLPWLRGAPGLKGRLLGGWKFSELSDIQTGSSLTPSLSIAHPGLATRPDQIAPVTRNKSLAEWFSTASFAAPAYGYYGDAAPGTILGPGLVNFDLALYKDFRIKERHTFQFRAEFFNAFNHANFNGVSTGFGSGNFGQVDSAADPRIMEFALRYQF